MFYFDVAWLTGIQQELGVSPNGSIRPFSVFVCLLFVLFAWLWFFLCVLFVLFVVF